MNFSNPAASGLVLAVALTAQAGWAALIPRWWAETRSPPGPVVKRFRMISCGPWNGSIPDPARFIFNRVRVIPEWSLIVRRLG